MSGDSVRDSVLVPALSTGSSLACVRSLGRRGVDTVAVAETPARPSVRSRYCTEHRHAPPPWDDVDRYAERLLELAARPDVRTVVPLQEADAYVLGRDRSAFAEHVATPWPTFDRLRTVQDRSRLFEVADRADVATPASRPADEWDRWDEPTVVKSRYSILVEDGTATYPDVRFFDGSDRPDVDGLVAAMDHLPLAQEYVPGDGEFGFFALYDHGDPVVTFQHRRIRSYDYAGGASVYRRSVDVPALAAAGRRLLDELSWHGPVMVEFKRDPRDGTFRLMEVNPRFWGSLALPVAAGVDFPYHYYRLATGDLGDESGAATDAAASEYETGVGCHVLVGEVSYLYSVLEASHDHVAPPSLPSALGEVCRSVLTDRNFDYLSLDDPGPFVSVVGANARDALGRIARSVAVGGGPLGGRRTTE